MVILLVFSSIFAYASSYENGVNSGLLHPKNEAWYVTSTSSELVNGKDANKSAKAPNSMVYRVEMPSLDPNQIFEKFTFSIVALDGSSRDTSKYVNLYKMPGDSWNVSAIRTSDIDSSHDAGSIEKSEILNGNDKIRRHTFDITAYANECIEQKYIYFAANIDTITASLYGCNGNNAPDYSFTPVAAPELTIQASSVSNGEEILCSKEISFTYSNPVKSVNITLNGKAADYNISGNVVTLNEELHQAQNYVLNITAADNYAGSHTYSMSFSTAIEITESSLGASLTKYITANSPADIAKGASAINGGNFAYYKLPLPAVTDNGFVEQYDLTVYAYRTTAPVDYATKVYGLDGEAWSDGNFKTTDEDFVTIKDDYDTYGIKNSVKNIGAGTPNSEYYITIDLAAYAQKCIDNGQSGMYIAITSTQTVSLYGNANWGGYGYRKPAAEVKSVNKAEIVPYNVSVNATGKTLKAVSFNLLTIADDVPGNVKLLKADNGEVVDSAAFSYNSSKREVTLSSPVSLDENTEYKLVLKEGFADKFGNTLTEDFVVSEFTTGKDFEIEALKVVLSDCSLAYDEATSVSKADIGKEYKLITKISNNTSSPVDIIIAIAVYNSSNELTDFSFEPTQIPTGENQEISTYSVKLASGTSRIKAFAWDNNYKPLSLSPEIKAQ